MDRKILLLKFMDGFGLLLVGATTAVILLGTYFLPFFGVVPITITPGDYVILMMCCGVGIMLMVHRIRYKIERQSQNIPIEKK